MASGPEHERIESPDRGAVPDGSEPPPAPAEGAASRSCSHPMEQTISFDGKRSDAESEALPPGGAGPAGAPATLGRYKIHGTLGQGGFGTVYLGFDDRLKRKVAIKVPTRVRAGVELDQFLEEARRLAQLRHPGIVTVFDVGESDGRCYIVSDYLEGASLADWMESKPCGWREAALIIAQLAEALAHAHSHGTVHRDVKPSNVIMLLSEQPVLIDFGLAISDAQGEREAPGTISGTPGYMSPEQATGKAHRIDGRTDIYALGVMLYHLLCRKRPFQATSADELFRQIREDDPQPPRQIVPDIPLELEQACLKAMAKRIHDRFSTALDMAVALRQIVQQAAVGDGREVRTETDRSPAPQAPPPSSQRSAKRMHEAERRQVTTLHLDLDDSNVDADRDPEELHSVVQRIRELAARTFARFGGHFAQSTSEVIQAYFGYPQAFEDSARRAVFAGLEIGSEIRRLQERSKKGDDLVVEFRVGIHTGIVVAEEAGSGISSERHSIVGNVSRVAAGLAALAETGSVVVSAATRQVLGDAFAYQSLGLHSGKAIGRDVELFAVVRQTGAAQDVAEEAAEGRMPLVGREHEMALLNARWEQARGGSGQVVLLCAEPGVGKSRLLAAFRMGLRGAGLETFEARSSAYHQNSAFHPIGELLKRLAQFSPEDADSLKLTKLEDFLKRLEIPLEPVVPSLVDLVSIPLGPSYAALEGTPERRKQKTIESLVELMLAAAESRPLLLTIDDLHWIDPTTLQFLTVLIEQLPAARILLVLTHRPTFLPPWPVRTNLAQLMIGHLTARQTADMMTRIAGGRKLPEEVVNHVVAKTGGVPLFTEELTKVILESNILNKSGNDYVLSRPLASVAIPSTLQDSLMARLDNLGSAKEVAQLAPVIGREFAFELLAAIAPLDEETLKAELASLVSSELVQQRGFYPRARFTFKHALVQDAAYESLLRKARQQWHGRIVDVLASQSSRAALSDPELLAHHCTEAGRVLPAIGYWEKAGLQAQERSANQEAISHFRQGLALVATLDESEARDGLEFKFQIPLGVALLAARGYATPEVGPVFERARELGQELAGPAEQFFIRWGIWAWRVVREELEQCRQMAGEALSLIEPVGDALLRMEALFIPALTSFYLGDFATSINCCEEGFALYDEAACKRHARHTGQNAGVTMQCYWALSLWHLGYPDQALHRARQAVELARTLKHPFSTAYALCHSGWLHHNCRLGDAVRRSADEEVALASEQGFAFWLAEGWLHRGFGLCLDQRFDESLKSLRTGLDIFNSTGAKLSLSHFYSIFSHAHLLAGNPEEALRWIDEAARASEINGNAAYLAEIHRLRGEVLLALPGNRAEEAEACFDQSLKIARAQQAKSWELRTTISLCRLRQKQNRRSEARSALAEIYHWFQEGFETPDLVDARQLLEALDRD